MFMYCSRVRQQDEVNRADTYASSIIYTSASSCSRANAECNTSTKSNSTHTNTNDTIKAITNRKNDTIPSNGIREEGAGSQYPPAVAAQCEAAFSIPIFDCGDREQIYIFAIELYPE